MDVVNDLVAFANEAPLENPEVKAALRDRIAAVETALSKFPQINPPIEHHFSNGVYAREMRLKKGDLIVGKIHKLENMNILSQGEVSVVSTDGIRRVKAPHTFVASPGVKRVIFAHEDAVWTTIHGTHETDLKIIEDEFTADTYEQFYLSTGKTIGDVLKVLGATTDHLKELENEDYVPFPKGFNLEVEVKASPIHGKGLFANKPFERSEPICFSVVDGKRTPAGRYANHSGEPNTMAISTGCGEVIFRAMKRIEKGDEILTDYFYNFINTRGLKCLG